MVVTLVNGDPFGNNFKVTDSNAGNAVIFNGYIDAHGETDVTCKESYAGKGDIVTYQDNNPGIGHSLLSDGDRINL